MVTFTDSQVGEMLARLARVQEIAIAIDEEREHWKGVAEKLHETVDERERAIDRFDKCIKSTEEELAMTQNALNKAVDIIVDRNRDLDEKDREIAAWKEREAYQASQRDILHTENVALREKLDMTCFLLDAIRKNLTTAGPWSDWHTKIALNRINAVLDAAKEYGSWTN